MILTISSPDKLTLSMFVDFYKSVYDSDVKIFDLNCLFSDQILEKKMQDIKMYDVKDASCVDRFVLIKLKTRIQTKQISPSIENISDFIIRFDLYSTEPEIIKMSVPEKIAPIIERWKKNIDMLNQS